VNENFTIGILVGGESRRMGRPKALIVVDGETLIERTVQLAKRQTDRVVLLGAAPFELPDSVADLPILPDSPGGVGPIGGLAALLKECAGRSGMLLACDLPRLSGPLLLRLIGGIGDDVDAVAFVAGPGSDDWEPCCAVYMASALPAVEAQIARQDCSLQSLLRNLRTRAIALSEKDRSLLANVNTPADLGGAYD
jgi:molybdopterin-guanine dinucleotide biosynthesis protein A